MIFAHIDFILILNMIFLTLPLISEVPFWSSSTALLISVLALFQVARKRNLLPTFIIQIFSVFFLGLILVTFKSLFSQEASTTFLLLLGALKSLELKTTRDRLVMAMLGYYLIMLSLIFSQSILLIAYMLIGVLTSTTLLYVIHNPGQIEIKTFGKSFAGSLKLFAYSLPILILLFFVFPRFTNPLARFLPENHGVSGFSDQLSPGDLSKIVLSDKVAFRATLENMGSYSPKDLYWRGGVLGVSNGLNWERKAIGSAPYESFSDSSPYRTVRPESIEQEITLEANYDKWLFALDFPIKIEPPESSTARIRFRGAGIFETKSPLLSRTRYRATSATQLNVKLPKTETLEEYLELPKIQSQKIKALVEKLSAAKTDQEKIQKTLNFFRKGFRYTLEPGTLYGDPLETFLFVSKKGFCEHFAGSFSTLMRMMNIPSRVVIGFQGGAFNNYGNFILVREKDAHAWSEVFVDGVWQRIDPTEVVSPERILLGSQFLEEAEPGLFYTDIGSQILQGAQIKQTGIYKMFQMALLRWDAITNSWYSFLLSYDLEFQKRWLAEFGIEKNQKLFLFLFALVGVVIFGFIIAFQKGRFKKSSRLSKMNSQFQKRLEKLGFMREPTEGHFDFLKRVQTEPRQDVLPLLRQYEDFLLEVYMRSRN